MLKFENEISDLTQTVEKMKKIESLLKDELFKKGLELDKANVKLDTLYFFQDYLVKLNFKDIIYKIQCLDRQLPLLNLKYWIYLDNLYIKKV